MKLVLHRYRAVILLAILAFAFFTRMYNLHNPPGYIFDEVYHAVTAKLIAQDDPRAYEWWNPAPEPDTAVDWLHPPLAKYMQAASILAFGENSFGWRFSSVVLGVLVILMTYHLSYAIFKKSSIALLSAFIASLDGLLLVQSRIAMNDIHVTFFILLALYLYHEYMNKQQLKYLLFSGVITGLAMATKWSGLFVLGIIWITEIFRFCSANLSGFSFKKHAIRTLLVQKAKFLAVRIPLLLLIPLTLYVTGYSHMFLQGKGVAHFKELHTQIWWYQTHLEAHHPYESRPVEWFLNIRPVWIYVQYFDDSHSRADMYAFGNPVLFWVGCILVFFSIFYLFYKFTQHLKKRNTEISKNSLLFLVFSYFMVWLPWQLSPRIMFFYHYTPAVPLLSIIIAYWLNKMSRTMPLMAVSVVVAMILAFGIWYPHWVAIPMPTEFVDTIYFAFPQWR